MVKIEVTADIARRIMEVGESIEIVDDSGRRLGYVARPITDDEIAAARKRADTEPGGSSLDEVWKRIRAENPEK